MKFKGFKPLIKTKRLELKPMPATFEMAHTLYASGKWATVQHTVCIYVARTLLLAWLISTQFHGKVHVGNSDTGWIPNTQAKA